MKRNEVYEQLTEIFRDVFDDNTLTIEDSTSPDDRLFYLYRLKTRWDGRDSAASPV